MFEKDPRDEERQGLPRASEANQGLPRASEASRGVEGIVREALPYAQYRVEIDGQRHVVAHAPGGPGRNFVRVLIGDRVRLELSPRDWTRGRIVEKIG